MTNSMVPINNRPTVPAPGESSAGWPVLAEDQTLLQAQRAANAALWAATATEANTALAALAVRTASLNARLAGDVHADRDAIEAAQAQIARETAFLNTIIAKCANGTYSNIVSTVYTLENAVPMIGGGTF